MKKIMLIGSGGAGKSTLAKELGKILQIEVIHLDAIHWYPNWQLVPREKQIQIQEELVQNEEWIIDGNWSGTLDIRLKAADTIIFLDYSRYLCIYRAVKRRILYRNKSRPDMVEGNKERLDANFLKYIWMYPKEKKPKVMEKLGEISDIKQVIILKSPEETRNFLSAIKMKETR